MVCRQRKEEVTLAEWMRPKLPIDAVVACSAKFQSDVRSFAGAWCERGAPVAARVDGSEYAGVVDARYATAVEMDG